MLGLEKSEDDPITKSMKIAILAIQVKSLPTWPLHFILLFLFLMRVLYCSVKMETKDSKEISSRLTRCCT